MNYDIGDLGIIFLFYFILFFCVLYLDYGGAMDPRKGLSD